MQPAFFARGNKKTLNKLTALRTQAHTDKAPRVALRIQAIMLSLQTYSVSEIARILHVHRGTVNSWIHAWNMHQEKGLMEGHRSGRQCHLTDEQQEQLNGYSGKRSCSLWTQHGGCGPRRSLD